MIPPSVCLHSTADISEQLVLVEVHVLKMSNLVDVHTQIASIMEVLANAAVSEICKVVDDGYAVLRLEISKSQNEIDTLKKKLHMTRLRCRRVCSERHGPPSQGFGKLSSPSFQMRNRIFNPIRSLRKSRSGLGR